VWFQFVEVNICGRGSFEKVALFYFFFAWEGVGAFKQCVLLDICRNNILSAADIRSSVLKIRQQNPGLNGRAVWRQ